MATTAIAVTIIVTNQKKRTIIRGTITNVTDTTTSMRATTTNMKVTKAIITKLKAPKAAPTK